MITPIATIETWFIITLVTIVSLVIQCMMTYEVYLSVKRTISLCGLDLVNAVLINYTIVVLWGNAYGLILATTVLTIFIFSTRQKVCGDDTLMITWSSLILSQCVVWFVLFNGFDVVLK